MTKSLQLEIKATLAIIESNLRDIFCCFIGNSLIEKETFTKALQFCWGTKEAVDTNPRIVLHLLKGLKPVLLECDKDLCYIILHSNLDEKKKAQLGRAKASIEGEIPDLTKRITACKKCEEYAEDERLQDAILGKKEPATPRVFTPQPRIAPEVLCTGRSDAHLAEFHPYLYYTDDMIIDI